MFEKVLIDKKILLGITGSIAAYKSAELVRFLTQQKSLVKSVLTDSASHFVTPLTLQSLSGHPVYSDWWEAEKQNPMLHIELARWADVILVAPASADFIARLNYGHANDLLTTLCLASQTPILIAPGMNQAMWLNSITQQNVLQLKSRGIFMLDPENGIQACGEWGPGRMMEPENILSYLNSFFSPKILNGTKVCITAGATQEAIDPVRYISNISSGKMGYALAKAFSDAGAEVILISGPSAQKSPVTKTLFVKTAQEMQNEVMKYVSQVDIFISAAAVSDYRLEQPFAQKIKKSKEKLSLHLIENSDILKSVTALPNAPFAVGFSAETDNLINYAIAKQKEKNTDLMIANLVDADGPFGSDENEVTIIKKNNEIIPIPKSSKKIIAEKIRDVVIQEYFLKKGMANKMIII